MINRKDPEKGRDAERLNQSETKLKKKKTTHKTKNKLTKKNLKQPVKTSQENQFRDKDKFC